MTMPIYNKDLLTLTPIFTAQGEFFINPKKVVFVERNSTNEITIWFDCVVTLEGKRFLVVRGTDFDELIGTLETAG